MNHTARLIALQTRLKEEQADWLWIPASDAHLNEYLPEAWKRRDWACGFTGSAGDLLIGQEAIWLFADSRYHEQAPKEVPSEVSISRVGAPGERTLGQFLERQGACSVILDTDTVSASMLQAIPKNKSKASNQGECC